VPSVSFFFPDRILSVSEEAAGFLVAQLERQSEAPEAVATLAKRIATEAHRGRLAAPGQDLELSHQEQTELLDALKGSVGSWPQDDREALHELQLALAVQTSQAGERET
jgi:hypothetical protein